MNLRYALLPYHYSLAHHAYDQGGIPMMRPLLWYFPSDPKVAEMTFQWMDGDKLMAAPVLQQDNSTSVYLPKAQWYEFNSTVVHSGPTTLSLQNVPLDHPAHRGAAWRAALAAGVRRRGRIVRAR